MKTKSQYGSIISLLRCCLLLFIIISFNLTHAYALDSEQLFKFANSLFPKQNTIATSSLFEEDIANLVKPSIVRIINHSVGTTTLVLDFKIDLNNQTIITIPTKKTMDIPFDLYFTGTGFIITPDGNILTNSHVVAKDRSTLNDNLAKLQEFLVISEVEKMTTKESDAFSKLASTSEGIELLKKFGEEIKKRLADNATTTSEVTVTVLDTLSNKDINTNDNNKETSLEKIKKLVLLGFPAKIIKNNDNFKDDERDVAIIKIEKNNLPAIPFAPNSMKPMLNIGQRIFTFGFPSNADVGGNIENNYLEPTFTSGMISSFKDSTKKDFKIIQTDAKISAGSSGSPAINQKGEVVGIMTLVTNIVSQTSGDSFGFALPLDPITDILEKANIQPETGNLYRHFIQGNQYFFEKHCTLALKEFIAAQDIDKDFHSTDFITPYIEKCRKMQQDKISIDSEFDQFKINIKPFKNTIYVSFGALFLLIIIGIVTTRRIKRDENKMEELEKHQIQNPNIPDSSIQNLQQTTVNQIQTPQIQASHNTQEELQRINTIVAYIEQQSVLPDTTPQTTVLNLKNMGYSDNEITNGFNILRNK